MRPPIYGLLAEFADATALVAAAHRVQGEGYTRTDAYPRLPVEGLAEGLGVRKPRLPLLVLLGGVVGCVGGFFMQYFAMAVHYPMNIGGRPLNSWPMFIPVTFELTVLVAGLTAVLGMLALNGLPMPYHPVFNVERFQLATRNRFFLCIESVDPKFNQETTRRFLESLKPQGVYEVER